MGRSSIANTFNMLRQKPALLLLLLPVPVASALLNKFTPPTTAEISSFSYDYSGLLLTLLMAGLALAVKVIGDITLMPPAMELLHDGAADCVTERGWCARGLKKHWWKPIALSAIELGVNFVLGVLFYFLVFFLSLILIIPIGFSASMDVSSAAGIGLLSLLFILVLAVFAALVFLFINSFFLFLLPALADRGFGAAFKVAFGKRGMKRIMKIFGMQLLLGIIGGAAMIGIGVVYVLLRGGFDLNGDFASLAASLTGSWTWFFASVFAAIIHLIIYPYAFSVFQEVVAEEDREIAVLLNP